MDSRHDNLYYGAVALLRRYDLRKFCVVFLLLWTLVDLACPGLCRGEALAPLYGQSHTAGVAVSPNHGGQPGRPSSRLPCDDDCFCCCQHIVPSSHFVFSVLEPTERTVLIVLLSSPDQLLQLPFHPPRS